jgi:hypothetical protein
MAFFQHDNNDDYLVWVCYVHKTANLKPNDTTSPGIREIGEIAQAAEIRIPHGLRGNTCGEMQ